MLKPKHQPVLAQTVVDFLQPEPGQLYLDLTAGFGGHAALIAQDIGPAGKLILVDRDKVAISELERQFPRARILHQDFDGATRELMDGGLAVDMLLLDLGLSSPQLATVERGFSFKSKGPLDMRMDQRQSLRAADVVNSSSETELADLIYQFGEERRSRQIAKAIVDSRPFTDTAQLAGVVARAYRQHSRIHPATRTFQALRLAVNDELGQLERTLPRLPQLLKPGGRLAVISFHSLEDRLVKQFLKSYRDELEPLTKKVVQGKTLDASNPHARSAKLRVAIKKAGSSRSRHKNKKGGSRWPSKSKP